jgi:hypothetical protein
MDICTQSDTLSLPKPWPAPALRARSRLARAITVAQIFTRPVRIRTVAEAVGVTPRAVRYWKCGRYLPNLRNWRRLSALVTLLREARHG